MSIEQRLLELADETLRDARWKTEIRKIAEEVRMIEARIKRLEEDLGDAYAEMRKQYPAITAVYDRSVWVKAKEVKP